MKVSMIAAMAENRAIGKDNDLIWSLPKDMRFFKTTTDGHHIIMGRKNLESIPHKYRPLPNRVNIVLTRNADFEAPGCEVFTDIKKALEFAEKAGEEEAFIIGGGEIYALALQENLVDCMYITHVHETFDADAFYPEFDENEWYSNTLMTHKKDEKNPIDFTVKKYFRKD